MSYSYSLPTTQLFPHHFCECTLSSIHMSSPLCACFFLLLPQPPHFFDTFLFLFHYLMLCYHCQFLPRFKKFSNFNLSLRLSQNNLLLSFNIPSFPEKNSSVPLIASGMTTDSHCLTFKIFTNMLMTPVFSSVTFNTVQFRTTGYSLHCLLLFSPNPSASVGSFQNAV